MKMAIRLLCYDLPGESNNIEMDIPDGSSIEEALEAFVEQQTVKLPLEALKNSFFHLNSKVAALRTPLSEGDQLTVLRTMGGG